MSRLGRIVRAVAIGVVLWGVLIGAAAAVIIHRDEQAAAARRPQTALRVTLNRREQWAWTHFPSYRRVIPILCYHGISRRTNHLTLTRHLFAEEMAALHVAGFHTISIAAYARYVTGQPVILPSRPILVTFDDGRLDSYRGADQVLARYGYQATMFVVASWPTEHPGFALQWSELAQMQRSGRWTIQEHAGRLHTHIPVDAAATQEEAYAYRRWIGGRRGHLESYAAYQRRVRSDVDWGQDQLRAHIPGYHAYAFAVPYSNYGQRGTNDPRIPAWFLGTLHQRVPVVVDGDYLDEGQGRPDEPKGRYTPTLAYRITEGAATSPATLQCRLRNFVTETPVWQEYSCIQPGPIGYVPHDSED